MSKGLPLKVVKIKRIENLSLRQKLNSFDSNFFVSFFHEISSNYGFQGVIRNGRKGQENKKCIL